MADQMAPSLELLVKNEVNVVPQYPFLAASDDPSCALSHDLSTAQLYLMRSTLTST